MSWGGLWRKLKTVPGAALGAIGVAVVGLIVTYFGPRLLKQLTAEDRPKISVRTNPASIDTFSDQAQFLTVPYGRRVVGGPQGTRMRWVSVLGNIRWWYPCRLHQLPAHRARWWRRSPDQRNASQGHVAKTARPGDRL
jgi:hypothetical protein